MRQFDVLRSVEARGPPYVLVLQSDLLDEAGTRVVAPLERRDRYREPAKVLNPVFLIEGGEVVMLTQLLATLHIRQLGPFVTSLASEKDRITAAMDRLLSGV